MNGVMSLRQVVAGWFSRRTKRQEPPAPKGFGTLTPGSYVVMQLDSDICTALLGREQHRYDTAALQRRKVAGLVRAVYTTDSPPVFKYAEVVSVNGSGSKRDYVVLEHEVVGITKCNDVPQL